MSDIEDLEYRLERYHEALTEAVNQRDRLALDAAWGIVTSSAGMLPLYGPIFFVSLLRVDLIWFIPAALFGITASILATNRAHRMRLEELKKLEPLPRWRRGD